MFAQDATGRTSLFAAAANGNLGTTVVLLGCADVGAARRAPAAARARSLRVCMCACVRAAQIHARDRRGRTPLFDAVEAGAADVAALLVRRGANPREPDAGGVTPEARAAAVGDAAMQRLLAGQGLGPVSPSAVTAAAGV